MPAGTVFQALGTAKKTGNFGFARNLSLFRELNGQQGARPGGPFPARAAIRGPSPAPFAGFPKKQETDNDPH